MAAVLDQKEDVGDQIGHAQKFAYINDYFYVGQKADVEEEEVVELLEQQLDQVGRFLVQLSVLLIELGVL